MLKKIANISPCEVLSEEFLIPLGIKTSKLSKELNIPLSYLDNFMNYKEKLSVEFALKLSKYFGNSTNFWLGLQNDFDIENESLKLKKDLEKINRFEFEITQ